MSEERGAAARRRSIFIAQLSPYCLPFAPASVKECNLFLPLLRCAAAPNGTHSLTAHSASRHGRFRIA